MIYNIKGKNISLADSTKEKVEAKLSRIEKFFSPTTTATVKISADKLDHTVEVTIPLEKRLVRAEVTLADMIAALDKAVDIIENQVIKHKGRMKTKVRKNQAFKAEYEAIPVEETLIDELQEIVIEKNKQFELRPMDPEEAVMQMELLDHSFFVFLNSETDSINVVYKRKNASYGIIEPEK